MNPRAIVSSEDLERIRVARAAHDDARAEWQAAEARWRDVVLDVNTRSSVRETAKAAGISPDTITVWKRR